MKRYIAYTIFLAFTLLVASCRSDNKGINKAPDNKISVQDNPPKPQFSEAEQTKAMGNIEFGISETQFEQALTEFKGTLEHNEFQTIYGVGDYMVSSFAGAFHRDSLHKLTLLGDLIPNERYHEELLPQLAAVKAIITKTYGEPHAGSGAPEQKQTTKGYSYKAYTWAIGTKTIDIKVANRGIYFSCDLVIYQPHVEKAMP